MIRLHEVYAEFHCCKHWVCMRVVAIENGQVTFEIGQPEQVVQYTNPLVMFEDRVASGQYVYVGRLLPQHADVPCPSGK